MSISFFDRRLVDRESAFVRRSASSIIWTEEKCRRKKRYTQPHVLRKNLAKRSIHLGQELARKQQELKEKKRNDYESLSYEEKQKRDAIMEKKMLRKRMNRKVNYSIGLLANARVASPD